MSKKTKNIVIVGAGLVGSLLAVMLGRRGYGVTVFEKRSDMRTRAMSAGRSINLALAERGIYPLKQAGLMDDVSKLLIPMRGRVLHERDATLEFFPYGQRPHEVIYSVSRGELNRIMMTAAETHCQVEILFEHDCQNVDLENRTIDFLDTSSGTQKKVDFDLVIGADGAGSAVRQSIVDATGGHCEIEMLDHDYKELGIPAGPGGDFQMEKEALHIWPRGGYMLIALPNLDGSFTVTLFLPKRGNPSFELIDEPHELQQFFADQFPDALSLIPDLQQDYFDNPQGELGTVRCDRWTCEDRALIVGDAAHAVVPFHGQGMNAGFEDCSELIRLLDKHQDAWSDVLPEFEVQRVPNANAIADMALENYVTMRDSVLDDDFQLKKELGFELERRFPNRFIPRYSMVMFHRIPYATVWARGKVQDQILSELICNSESLEQVDLSRATELIQQRLTEFDVE